MPLRPSLCLSGNGPDYKPNWKTITFKNIGLAQGHAGASNNWVTTKILSVSLFLCVPNKGHCSGSYVTPLLLRCYSAFTSTDIPQIAVSLPSRKSSSLSLPCSQLSNQEKLQIANCKLQIQYFLCCFPKVLII